MLTFLGKYYATEYFDKFISIVSMTCVEYSFVPIDARDQGAGNG